MAGTATATYGPDVWTSTSTVDASQQQWEFAVPINGENRRRSKSRTSRKSRDRGSKGSRSSSLSKQIYNHEQSHHAPRGRRDPSLSRTESENGGVQDTAASPHINGSRKSDVTEGEQNDEKWIHRDKLARIESEELQQAAILFQRRPGTGSTKGRGRSRDQQHGSVSGATATTATHHEPLEPWPDLQEDQQNNAARSAPANGHDITEEERQCWDLRRPEEIAAERESSASSMYRNPGLRKSSSRIPIPMSSPASRSPQNNDREYFSSRSRAPTDEDEEAASRGMPRRASEPLTVDSASNSDPASESRPGSRGWPSSQNAATKKATAKTGSTSRKTSAPNPKKPSPRSRATSSNANQRPTTRAGEPRPPTAINRPEGDPPWLATMYKPDPRLPPDQQILPTHARKMQQEQWEKEGKTPTMYDREFAPLAIVPDQSQPVKKTEKEAEKESEQPEPLKPEGLGLQPPPKSPEPSRPGTSTGYSPMPKVQDPPPTGLTPRFNSQTVVTAQGPPPEDDKVDKGCGCCIVM
ncbi:uncharacterized protein DSM5745_00623 [Aspergillus mulundensis]|uniref:Putative TeaA receptor TeaR n=1 Tax=Aspergillus mulundensis TaxID=1810919 RepID=A0A3D8T4C1_9EURO|nr:putative TeaA receptor TeaR [Aspergillus mulundensis]RDW93301.1 putative TeaA receptor TeaR [Aspergillus mulundensis]